MKAYNEYMDSISVSDTLHRKLASCASKVKPIHRSFVVRRYAAIFTCLAAILLGVLTMPHPLPKKR